MRISAVFAVKRCLSHAVIVSKRLNLSWNFFDLLVAPFPIQRGRKMHDGVGRVCDFRPKSPSILETVRDRPMVTMERLGSVRWRIDTCASGCVLQCRICNREVAGSNLSLGYLIRTKVYSAFHPSGVGKRVPAAAGKAKAGMAHSDCGWTCGCAGKTVKSLDNTCHTWALLRWWFTTKRRYIKCMYLLTFTCRFRLPLTWISRSQHFSKSNISKTVHFRDKVTIEH